MISDEEVSQVVRGKLSFLSAPWKGNQSLPTAFFRGIPWHDWDGQHSIGCDRHLYVFKEYNAIPRYCFDCYKVLVEPRTVMELFKLMVIFDRVKFRQDYTRKCYVEGRKEISGAYKGFIYCRSVEVGEEVSRVIQAVVSEDISGGASRLH